MTSSKDRYIRVRVTTGAKKERVMKTEKGFEVAVKEKPVMNAANARVITLVSRALGVSESSIRIARGHHSTSKLIEIITRK